MNNNPYANSTRRVEAPNSGAEKPQVIQNTESVCTLKDIPSALDEYARLIERLQKEVAVLLSKIEPVVYHSPEVKENDTKEKCKVTQNGSPLSQSLVSCNSQLRDICNQLSYTESRIQL